MVKFIKRIQADALEHAATIAENYQQQVYRVDSKEAEAIRGVNCKIRAQIEKLKSPNDPDRARLTSEYERGRAEERKSWGVQPDEKAQR